MIKEITTTRFKQSSVGWCSVYTIANVFNNHNALDFITEERFKGSTDKEELEVIRHLGERELKISNIMFSTSLVKAPSIEYVFNTIETISQLDKEFVEQIDEELLPFIPFFLVVRLTEKAKLWHRVGIMVYKDRYFYTDPYRENILEIENHNDLGELFIECAGIDRLSMEVGDEERYQILYGKNLGHDWLKDIN